LPRGSSSPRLFAVRVRRNRRLELLELISLRKKLFGLAVYSVVVLDSFPDFVFVEARDLVSVADAIKYFSGARLVGELPGSDFDKVVDLVMGVVSSEYSRKSKADVPDFLRDGNVVELNRGPFRGRLARVESVCEDKVQLRVSINKDSSVLLDVGLGEVLSWEPSPPPKDKH